MRNGIYPTRILLILFIAPLALVCLGLAWEILIPVGFGLDALLLLVVITDLLTSASYKKDLVLEPHFPAILLLGRNNRFEIEIENRSGAPLRFSLLFDFDSSFDREYSTHHLRLKAGERRRETLGIFARRRGTFHAARVFVRGRSRFGLLYLYRRHAVDITVSVPPLLKPVNQVFKLIQKKIERGGGSQRSAVLGEGRDFEMLKDYQRGDDFNLIDWKATARILKPVTRVYRLENSMEVALLVDCGRIMATEVEGMSLLDYACDAALILGLSAVRNNDSVSLFCFTDRVTEYIPPVRQKKDVQKLSLVLSRAQFEHLEPNYRAALLFAGQKLTKRSIMLIFTDVLDDSNILVLKRYVAGMARRHLVILILIRDKHLFRTSEAVADETLSLYTKAAAADLVLRRNRTIHDLRRLGVDVLDVDPQEVSARLLNRYLELKKRN